MNYRNTEMIGKSLEGQGRARKLTAKHRDWFDAYLFLAPTLLIFLVFVFGPLVSSLVISFYKWNLLSFSQRTFVGFRHFASLFAGHSSARFYLIYGNTLLFVAAEIILFLLVGLLCAMLLNYQFKRPMQYVLRVGYFLPLVTSTAIVAGIWAFLLNTNLGIVNYYLGVIGIQPVPWLNNPYWAKASVIIFDVWKNFGFYTLVFLAGLQNIPGYLYEAAEIDGASSFYKLRRITLPMLSPTTFFLLVIGFINSVQLFDSPYVLTDGTPGDSTRTVVMLIYQDAFQNFDLGKASAVAMTLFAVILLGSIGQFIGQRRWVYYG